MQLHLQHKNEKIVWNVAFSSWVRGGRVGSQIFRSNYSVEGSRPIISIGDFEARPAEQKLYYRNGANWTKYLPPTIKYEGINVENIAWP